MPSTLWIFLGLALVLPPLASRAQPAPDRQHFDLKQVGSAAAHRFTLSHAALAAAVLSETGEAAAVEPAATQVVIPAQHLAVFKTAAVATRVPPVAGAPDGRVRWEIPVEYAFVPDVGPPRSSHLVAEVAGKMRMVSGSVFRTELLLRLEDRADPTQRYALPQPAQVMVVAPVDSVDPAELSFAETSVWHKVVLETANPANSIAARVLSSVDRDGLAIDLGIDRPALAVSIERPSIQGLGLEAAQVTVSVTGLPESEGREVALEVTERGSLETSRVRLDARGFASTRLRSTSIGPTEVRARSPQLADATSNTIRFDAPWAFALAALLGGTVGAVLKRLTSATRAGAGRVVTAGVLAGVGTAVLCAAGVNVARIALPTAGGEALVASIALLGGLVGLRPPKAASD